MLPMAKLRICPSLSCISWVKSLRQAPGAIKGNKPSMTSTNAKASQKVSPAKATSWG